MFLFKTEKCACTFSPISLANRNSTASDAIPIVKILHVLTHFPKYEVSKYYKNKSFRTVLYQVVGDDPESKKWLDKQEELFGGAGRVLETGAASAPDIGDLVKNVAVNELAGTVAGFNQVSTDLQVAAGVTLKSAGVMQEAAESLRQSYESFQNTFQIEKSIAMERAEFERNIERERAEVQKQRAGFETLQANHAHWKNKMRGFNDDITDAKQKYLKDEEAHATGRRKTPADKNALRKKISESEAKYLAVNMEVCTAQKEERFVNQDMLLCVKPNITMTVMATPRQAKVPKVDLQVGIPFFGPGGSSSGVGTKRGRPRTNFGHQREQV